MIPDYHNLQYNIKLYKGDFMEVMPYLRRVDCLVTDPPYFIQSRGSDGTTGGMLKKSIVKSGKVFKHNAINIKDWIVPAYNLLNESSHAYIMCNNYNLYNFLDIINKTNFHFTRSLIWDKGNKICNSYYMSQFEYILFCRKGKAKIINNCGTSDIIRMPNKKTKDLNGNNIHDTEKPVKLMKILIENSTQKGEMVIDPFMGSGTTGIACLNTGRGFIGIELDDAYFEISVNRIEKRIKEIEAGALVEQGKLQESQDILNPNNKQRFLF